MSVDTQAVARVGFFYRAVLGVLVVVSILPAFFSGESLVEPALTALVVLGLALVLSRFLLVVTRRIGYGYVTPEAIESPGEYGPAREELLGRVAVFGLIVFTIAVIVLLSGRITHPILVIAVYLAGILLPMGPVYAVLVTTCESLTHRTIRYNLVTFYGLVALSLALAVALLLLFWTAVFALPSDRPPV